MTKPPLSQLAKGKWPAILAALGVDKAYLTGRHGPCPICGGKDRFRFDNKDGRGTYYCSQCGSGDGIELVKRLNNWDFKQAAPEIEKHLGTAPVTPIRQGRPEAVVREEMNSIWRGAKPLSAVEAATLWWSRRIGQMPAANDLRAVMSLSCPGAGVHPGMVALVRGPDGAAVNLHRTFLTADGHKADIPEPRRVMDAPLPKGSAVRLFEPGEELGVAEGIETAVSCKLLFGIPTWALLNAENLTGFAPPPGVKRLVIFGDNDRSWTGHWASYALGRRMRCAEPWKSTLEVEVQIPPRESADWNDVWREVLGRNGPIQSVSPEIQREFGIEPAGPRAVGRVA